MSVPAPPTVGLRSRLIPGYLALFDIITAAVTPAGVVVYAGRPVTPPTEFDCVLVGVTDPTVAVGMVFAAVAATGTEWATLTQAGQDETGVLYGTYVAWTGEDDLLGVLARIHTNLGLIEAALLVDPAGVTLNGALVDPAWCRFEFYQADTIRDTAGVAVHARFRVTYQARI